KPRAEPASGLAGGKLAQLDRIEWTWIPDPQTQVNALLSGEIDMIESVAFDLLPLLENDKGVRLIRGVSSNQDVFAMNWSHSSFSNAKVRQAALVALRQFPGGRGRQFAVLAHAQGPVHLRFPARNRRRDGWPAHTLRTRRARAAPRRRGTCCARPVM